MEKDLPRKKDIRVSGRRLQLKGATIKAGSMQVKKSITKTYPVLSPNGKVFIIEGTLFERDDRYVLYGEESITMNMFDEGPPFY
jgi:hypothetical protein